MVELRVVDSLWVHVPYFKQYPIPAAVLASLVSVAGSLLIALIVYRLARHQFRSNRWWEWQARRYSAIVDALVTIRDSAAEVRSGTS